MTAVQVSDSSAWMRPSSVRTDHSWALSGAVVDSQKDLAATVINLEDERDRRSRLASAEQRERELAKLRHPSVRARVQAPSQGALSPLIMKAVAYLLTLAFVVVGGGFVGLLLREPAYQGVTWEHSVSQGESLWSVAAGIETGRQIEEVMEDIRQLNNLERDGLMIGQQLTLPAE